MSLPADAARSCEGSSLRRAFCAARGGSAAGSVLGDPRASTSASSCDANVADGFTGVCTSTAVSIDCGRDARVPATRDMFMLGSEGSAKERANEEKEGKLEDVAAAAAAADSGGGGSCFGGGAGGCGGGGGG